MYSDETFQQIAKLIKRRNKCRLVVKLVNEK